MNSTTEQTQVDKQGNSAKTQRQQPVETDYLVYSTYHIQTLCARYKMDEREF